MPQSGPPLPPTDVAPHNFMESLLISWSAAFSPHSIPLTYQLELSTENGTNITIIPSNSTTLDLTPHAPHCTPLQIRVFAINAAGRSNSSQAVEAFVFSGECMW